MRGIVIRRLGKRFGPRVLFRDLELALPDHGLYGLVGESGSGKSTLLDIVAGLDADYGGEVLTLGVALQRLSEEERSAFRLRHLGYLRQDYGLLENETALANVLFPLQAFALKPALARREVADLLAAVGLTAKAKTRVNRLSGGERQRVALARAYATDPPLLIADEPTGALDAANAEILFRSLQAYAARHLVLVASHDEALLRRYASGLFRLAEGRLLPDAAKPIPGAENPLVLLPAKEPQPQIPFRAWLTHAWHLLTAKKGRSLLTAGLLFFALSSFGGTLYAARDLSAELGASFSLLTGEGAVAVAPAQEGPLLSAVRGSSEAEMAALAAGESMYG